MKGYIYIVNLGDYYSHLTVKRLRKVKPYLRARIINFNTPIRNFQNVIGIILSGSYQDSRRVPPQIIDPKLFKFNVPIMGICLGSQLITLLHRGRVRRDKNMAEYGEVEMKLLERGGLFEGLSLKEPVWMQHSDSISKLPSEFITMARTKRCPIVSFRHKSRLVFGFQFHPELSVCGNKIFKNFISLCNSTAKKKDLDKSVPILGKKINREIPQVWEN